MCNIEAFHWFDRLPASGDGTNLMHDMLEAVASPSGCLKSLVICPPYEQYFSTTREVPSTTLTLGVTRMCEKFQTEEFYTQILTMLNLSLHDVHLDFIEGRHTSTDAQLWKDLLKTATWLSLTRLSIQGTYYYNDDIQSAVFGKFLQRHPNLKALALLKQRLPTISMGYPEYVVAWPLFPKILPENMRYLYVDGMDPIGLMLKIFHNLSYVNAVFGDKSLHLLKRFPTLQYCYLHIRQRNVKIFVDAVPNVERMRLSVCEEAGNRIKVLAIGEVGYFLSSLPFSTHLAICKFNIAFRSSQSCPILGLSSHSGFSTFDIGVIASSKKRLKLFRHLRISKYTMGMHLYGLKYSEIMEVTTPVIK
ncbi:hypothetical protein M422DRAFT_43135 [Sphaerobolus stellatus SS14]|nr:hypothetical protein M422DRAFT_43135 [Sphaerobolus stellatus SS14]